MSLSAEAKEALRVLDTHPQKRRGQNFMVDLRSLEAIADAVGQGSPSSILEIGPGLGFLTRELLKKAPIVLAVEKDRNFTKYLTEHFRGSKLKVLEKDVLETDLKADFGVKHPLNVCGNIPYNITSPILEWLIGQRDLVRRAVLTVQAEVADRLSANADTKAWGALSIFVQTHAKVRILRKVPKSSFFPEPKVNSAVVELEFLADASFCARDRNLFFRLVRKAFQKRRKTALNALRDETDDLFTKKNLSEAFLRASIDPSRRPETFMIPEWSRLSDSML